MTTPAPLKFVKMKLSDRGEILLELDGSPTDEFMTGFKTYWAKPTGSVSPAFDRRVFDRFEGSAIVFQKMPVDQFEANHLGVAKDALKAANEFVAEIHSKRAEQAAAREKAKQTEREELETERGKAEQVRFDQ